MDNLNALFVTKNRFAYGFRLSSNRYGENLQTRSNRGSLTCSSEGWKTGDSSNRCSGVTPQSKRKADPDLSPITRYRTSIWIAPESLFVASFVDFAETGSVRTFFRIAVL